MKLYPTWGLTSNIRQNKQCILKINGGEGGGNHGEELHKEIRERGRPKHSIAGGGGDWERENKEREHKEERRRKGWAEPV
jgi:hypothetical protein